MKNSNSVKSIIRKDKIKKDGDCPIYLSVIVNGKQLRLPTGKYWNLNQWGSKENSYPKGIGASSLKALLENKEQKIRDYINRLDMADKPITFGAIKDFYNGKSNQRDFYYHFDRFTEKKFYKISKGTQNHYLLLKKQLKEFDQSFLINQLDYSFINDFFFFLRHSKKVGKSGLAMRRKNFITVLEEFIKLELIEKNYCKEIPRFKEKVKTTFLTKSEISKIKEAHLEIPNLSYGLNLTRDLFLFSCYTGLRYSDVINLKSDGIKENRIVIEIQKTKKEIMIPIGNEALALLIKYSYHKKFENIFPKRCNVSVNRDLKLISKIAKVNKCITFHVGRHTFGSTLAVEGVQPFYIMKLMGHADIRMTTRYVNTDFDILEDALKKVNFSLVQK